jgi:hypothetical protein
MFGEQGTLQVHIKFYAISLSIRYLDILVQRMRVWEKRGRMKDDGGWGTSLDRVGSPGWWEMTSEDWEQ